MRSRWRTSYWSGAAIGVVAAVVLTWLVREGWQAFVSAGQEGLAFAKPGWLLVLVGTVLTATVVGAQFHPLIPAVPAVWFLLLFGPGLIGDFRPTDWYPEWMQTYILVAMSPAVFVVIGVLAAATIAAYVWRRPPLARARSYRCRIDALETAHEWLANQRSCA